MIYAVIIAGGVGSRMGYDIPKQFVEINGKPIIIYTLENFQFNEKIDFIEVVCIEDWIKTLQEYVNKYNLTKVKLIVKGGSIGQESIRNGVYALKDYCSDQDIVVIHDGIRPLVNKEILDDVISVCKEKGNAVTSMPYNEQIFLKDDEFSTLKYIPRDTLRRVSTPQAYTFGKLYTCYKKAFEEKIGISPSSYTNTMMVELGERLYFAAGSDKNIKLTTPDDIKIFKALLSIEENKK